MFVRKVDGREFEGWRRKLAGVHGGPARLQPGLQRTTGKMNDTEDLHMFKLYCPTDAVSTLASTLTLQVLPQGPEGKLPPGSSVILGQRNSDPQLVFNFLWRQRGTISHLLIDNLNTDLTPIFASLFSPCSNISVLVISGVDLQKKEAESLRDLLACDGKSRLVRLKMHTISICTQGLLQIAAGLATSSKCFDTFQLLKPNRLSIADLDALCSPMKCIGTTRPLTLQLDRCSIGAGGACVLARALSTEMTFWCYLETLRIGYVQLGASGATTMAAALRNNNSLRCLMMPGNDISADGGLEMAKMLQDNIFLRHVSFHNNNFKDEGMEHFVERLGRLRLESLDVSYNQISPAMEKRLIAAGNVSDHPIATARLSTSSSKSAAVSLSDPSCELAYTQGSTSKVLQYYNSADRQNDCVAVAMGQHFRLGSSSPLLLLDEPMVYFIMQVERSPGRLHTRTDQRLATQPEHGTQGMACTSAVIIAT